MKTNILKFIIFIICFSFGITNLQANSAQPGVWNAGGKVFTMLYPEDSATFKKVQMQEERIFIQLYKGYAVVKGWYQFRNTTDEVLNFKMGYPVNGIYSGGEVYLNQIELDSLSSFKIFSENQPLQTILQPNHSDFGNITTFINNWYAWEMNFAPNQTKEVAVFFIVETNNGGVSKGYNQERYNAFIYLLESGIVWKNPIEKGDFYIQLMDGLTQENIHGISDHFNMKFNEHERIFWGQKINFSPTIKDNLVITYHEKSEDFNFKNVLEKTDELYKNIENFSKTQFQNVNFTHYETKDPYFIKATAEGYLPFVLTNLAIALPFIVGAIMFIFVVILIIKFLKRKNRKN